MTARNSLLACLALGLGTALLALAYLVVPSDPPVGTVAASASKLDPGAAAGPLAGEDVRRPETAGGPEADGPGGRLAVAGEERSPELGAFEADALYGRVVDPDHEAVAGAHLFLFEDRDRTGDGASPEETVTDEGGRFRFRGCREFHAYTLVAFAEGFFPGSRTWTAGRDEELTLQPGMAIAGRVLDAATAEPLAGVDLATGAPQIAAGHLADRVHAVSDAEGRYRLSPVRTEGLLRIDARRPGYQREQVEVQLRPDHPEGYDLRLGAGPTVVLELYDLETDEPVADTEVQLGDGHRGTTDADGRLSLVPRPTRGGRSPRLEVEATVEGWCRTRYSAALEAERYPDLLRLPLCRGGPVFGRVTAEGAPVEDALVTIRSADRRRRGGRGLSGPVGNDLELPPGVRLEDGDGDRRTKADGGYRIPGIVPQGAKSSLRVEHLLFPPTTAPSFDVPGTGEEVEVNVEFGPGSVVQGTVRMNGEPAAVELNWRGAAGSRGTTLANDRGAYRIVAVPPGELSITVRVPGGGWPRDDEERDVLEIAPHSVVEHDIERFSEQALIQGRVREAGGRPLGDLDVTAWGEGPDGEGGGGRTKTAPDGTFELAVTPLPGIAYTVFVRDGTREAWAEDVPAGTRGLELVLPEMGLLGLRVVDEAQREPVPRFQVFWRREGSPDYADLRMGRRELSPGPGGVFLAELPLGPVDLLVGAPGEGYATIELRGLSVDRRDPPRVVEAVLPRGTRVELVFVPPEDSPGANPPRNLARAGMVLAAPGEIPETGTGDASALRAILARRGRGIRPYGPRTTLTAVEPGRYRIEGVPEEFALEPMEIDVPATDQAVFEIHWRPEVQ